MKIVSLTRANPALAPLFLFTGTGCFAAAWFGAHVLRKHPEVQIDKKHNPYPWQHVKQHENMKLLTPHPQFYENRKHMEQPSVPSP